MAGVKAERDQALSKADQAVRDASDLQRALRYDGIVSLSYGMASLGFA